MLHINPFRGLQPQCDAAGRDIERETRTKLVAKRCHQCIPACVYCASDTANVSLNFTFLEQFCDRRTSSTWSPCMSINDRWAAIRSISGIRRDDVSQPQCGGQHLGERTDVDHHAEPVGARER